MMHKGVFSKLVKFRFEKSALEARKKREELTVEISIWLKNFIFKFSTNACLRLRRYLFSVYN